MAIRYTSAQLLKLRESPLVAKPTNLPPIEEWMGQSAESNQRRSNSSNVRNDGQSKTLPKMGNGGILLGPPKSTFISSSSSSFKTTNGPFDAGRSAFGSFGADTARSDFNSKGRYNDRQTGEGDDRHQRSTGRRGDSNWTAGLDDDEKAHHRNTGRDGDGEGQDGRRRGYDNQRRDDDTRRNVTGRANRPSWLRDDDALESRPREGARSNDWRDAGARRAQDRGWNRAPLVERDEEPEWMVGDASEEKKGRTAQDMEEWKASMKAREKGAATTESTEASHQHSRTTSNTMGKMKTETPLMLDPSLDDKFFGFMNTPSATGGTSRTDAIAKGTKSSKFSGLFGPQTPAGPADAIAAPPPPAPSGPASAPPDPINDDKAGFQRILAMLNAPQPGSGSVPLNATQQRQATPSGDKGALKPANSPPPIISPRSRRPGAFDNLLGMQSPDEGLHRPQAQSQPQPHSHPHGPLSPSNKDADFLLTLLRTRDGDSQAQGPPPGLGGRSQQQFHSGPLAGGEEPGHQPGSGGGGMFDDFAAISRHRGPSDPSQSNAQHPPPSQQGPPPPRYEDDDHERRGGGDYPQHFPPMGMPGPPPPGLGRPPGFEGMPLPPGFPQYMHSPPQHQHGGMVGPPPGFGNRPPPHGHNGPGGQHNAFPPNFLPGIGNMSLNERGGGGGVGGGNGAGGPPYGGPPPPGNMRGPGPGPPPGFMGMNGPPPGFSPLDLFTGGPGGPGGGPGGPPPGHGPPPPPGRMLELFGVGEGRGGPGGPPPLGQQGMQLQGQGQFRRE